MSRLRVPLLALALVLALAGVEDARAQQPPTASAGFEVVITLDPAQPRLGDRVRLTITVTHPADRLLAVASAPDPPGDVEVLEALPEASEPLGERMVTEYVYILAAFDLGPLDLGSVRLAALGEDGSVQDLTFALPTLDVRTTVTPADVALRALKPQVAIAGAPPAWRAFAIAGGAAATVLALVALLLVFLLRGRRRAGLPALAPLPPATAEDQARARLDAIRRARLLGAGDYERYFGELSLTVRRYLEERYGFRATALTTRELERAMTFAGVDRWQARLVAGLLDRCDAAVYAHDYPNAVSADHDLTVAYEIVELSRPRRELIEAAEAVPA